MSQDSIPGRSRNTRPGDGQERNAIYDRDLASAQTYDLTAQADDLSSDTTPDLTQPASVTPRGPHAHFATMLADASPRRRALRLALTMVLGRDDGFLARRK